MRVYRWDLDKTYLHTDIASVRGLVRSAVEPAHAKRAIPGAPALLRALGRERPDGRDGIFVLSGSPVQMRGVLEQKLRLDGVRFDAFVLKDNLTNLKRGRLRAVRGQFGYKLPQLLRARVGLAAEVRESLFGDDAEVDALVYSVYADAIAGRIGASELSRVLEAAGAYPDHIVDALAALARVSRSDAVERIFIRIERRRPLAALGLLGTRVVPVHTWFEAALVLHAAGEIPVEGLRSVREATALAGPALGAAVARMLTLGRAPMNTVAGLLDAFDSPADRAAVERVLARGPYAYHPPVPPPNVDYVEVLRAYTREQSRDRQGIGVT